MVFNLFATMVYFRFPCERVQKETKSDLKIVMYCRSSKLHTFALGIYYKYLNWCAALNTICLLVSFGVLGLLKKNAQ